MRAFLAAAAIAVFAGWIVISAWRNRGELDRLTREAQADEAARKARTEEGT